MSIYQIRYQWDNMQIKLFKNDITEAKFLKKIP